MKRLREIALPGMFDVPTTVDMTPGFDGAVYEPEQDHARLAGQMLRIYGLMKDGQWRTVQEIASLTGDPETSVSAQLRNLRKPRFGAVTVDKRTRGDGVALWEYRVSS